MTSSRHCGSTYGGGFDSSSSDSGPLTRHAGSSQASRRLGSLGSRSMTSSIFVAYWTIDRRTRVPYLRGQSQQMIYRAEGDNTSDQDQASTRHHGKAKKAPGSRPHSSHEAAKRVSSSTGAIP